MTEREGRQTRALTDWHAGPNSYHRVRNPFSNKEATLDPTQSQPFNKREKFILMSSDNH
jgi:hypothetical protein